MKIGFFKLGLDNPIVKTIFSGMYNSFFNALEQVGFQPELVFSNNFSNYDLLVVPLGEGQETKSAEAIDKFKGPTIAYTTPANNWFKASFLKRWAHRILFVYSTDASGYSTECYRKVGLSHLHLAFGSDDRVFHSLVVPKAYDVLFVANAWSGTGRYTYINHLMKKAEQKKWKIMLFGGGWEKYGYSQQLIGHGDLLNLIYNSARININLFNIEQNLGLKKCLDANNRLFDLAMAGCFQICNAPTIVSNYFTKEEVVAEDNPTEWLEKIEYYLESDKQRNQIANCAKERAIKDHTWLNRADRFKRHVETCLQHYENKKPTGSILSPVLRKIDYTVPSTYRIRLKVKKAYRKLLS